MHLFIFPRKRLVFPRWNFNHTTVINTRFQCSSIVFQSPHCAIKVPSSHTSLVVLIRKFLLFRPHLDVLFVFHLVSHKLLSKNLGCAAFSFVCPSTSVSEPAAHADGRVPSTLPTPHDDPSSKVNLSFCKACHPRNVSCLWNVCLCVFLITACHSCAAFTKT